jgi:hypothetical protein
MPSFPNQWTRAIPTSRHTKVEEKAIEAIEYECERMDSKMEQEKK